MTPRSVMLLAFALLATGATSAVAQVGQTSDCPYVTCAVRLTSGFFGERLVRGETSEEVLKIGFTGGNAADFLARVEAAAGPAREFRTRRTRAAVLAMVGAAAAGYFFGSAYGTSGSSIAEDPTSTEYAVLFGGLAVGIWGGVEAMRSRNSLSRAIWEFNRAPVP